MECEQEIQDRASIRTARDWRAGDIQHVIVGPVDSAIAEHGPSADRVHPVHMGAQTRGGLERSGDEEDEGDEAGEKDGEASRAEDECSDDETDKPPPPQATNVDEFWDTDRLRGVMKRETRKRIGVGIGVMYWRHAYPAIQREKTVDDGVRKGWIAYTTTGRPRFDVADRSGRPGRAATVGHARPAGTDASMEADARGGRRAADEALVRGRCGIPRGTEAGVGCHRVRYAPGVGDHAHGSRQGLVVHAAGGAVGRWSDDRHRADHIGAAGFRGSMRPRWDPVCGMERVAAAVPCEDRVGDARVGRVGGAWPIRRRKADQASVEANRHGRVPHDFRVDGGIASEGAGVVLNGGDVGAGGVFDGAVAAE